MPTKRESDLKTVYQYRRAKFCAALRTNAHRQIVDQMYDPHGGCCAMGLFIEVMGFRPKFAEELRFLGIPRTGEYDSLIYANEKFEQAGKDQAFYSAVRLTFPQIADWIEAQPYLVE